MDASWVKSVIQDQIHRIMVMSRTAVEMIALRAPPNGFRNEWAFLIVCAVDAHVFGWRWPLIVRTVCAARTATYRDCVTMRQLAVTGLSLDMAKILNDVRIYYIVFVPVPASAVPNNWCLEVGCTTQRR